MFNVCCLLSTSESALCSPLTSCEAARSCMAWKLFCCLMPPAMPRPGALTPSSRLVRPELFFFSMSAMSPMTMLTRAYSIRDRNTNTVQPDMNTSIACNKEVIRWEEVELTLSYKYWLLISFLIRTHWYSCCRANTQSLPRLAQLYNKLNTSPDLWWTHWHFFHSNLELGNRNIHKSCHRKIHISYFIHFRGTKILALAFYIKPNDRNVTLSFFQLNPFRRVFLC